MDQVIGSPPARGPASAARGDLSALERRIVEIVATFYDETHRSDIVRALSLTGYRHGTRAATAPDILPTLESLTQRGWLVGASHWRAAPGVARPITYAMIAEQRFAELAAVIRRVRPAPADGSRHAARELWIALFSGRWDEARAALRLCLRTDVADVCTPIDRAWMRCLPGDLRALVLRDTLDVSFDVLESADDALLLLEELARQGDVGDGVHHALVEQLILRGRFDDADKLLAPRSSHQARVGRAWLLALRGRWSEAIAAYEVALTAYLKDAGRRARFLPDRAGVFFIVALIADGRPASLERAKTLSAAGAKEGVTGYPRAHAILGEVAAALAHTTEVEALLYLTLERDLDEHDPIVALIWGLAVRWLGLPLGNVAATLAARKARAEGAGYIWLAAQGAAVVGAQASPAAKAPGVMLVDAVTRTERWSGALDALLAIASNNPAPRADAPSTSGDRRLIWLVTERYTRTELEPREQSRTKGVWTRGRPVALKRLYHESSAMDFLGPEDRLAIAAIAENVELAGRYRNVYYNLDHGRAFTALVGRPNVFAEVGGELVPVDIRRRATVLRVERCAKGAFRVCLDPAPRSPEEANCVVRAGPAAVELVEFLPHHHAVAAALGRKPLELPASAEGRLRGVVAALSGRIAVEADLIADTRAEPGLDADAQPRFVVRGLGEGISVQAIVRPLGATGPAVRPGHGGTTVFAEVDGARRRAVRTLDEERTRLAAVTSACPVLAASEDAPASYALPERDDALEALLELHAITPPIELEWPDGGELRVEDPVGIDRLTVAIRAEGDRFDVSGTLALAEPLDLSTLIGYLAASPGRFLRLAGDGRFFALTSDLRARLDELRSLAELAGKRLRLHGLLSSRVDELLRGAELRADAEWTRQVSRLRATGVDPEVPSTFRGELRPYQLDGFRWLARLGRWGAGACLADEMGLGKTVQVIALLLHRAAEGPSLVVCPTSMLPTWEDELARFAPTLNVRTFAGSQRAELLDDLGSFDVVLTTYALLQQDIERLEPVRFSVTVLDEAQAIKNVETRRARAAQRLTSEFRVATTGTPIENRLEELWSLFRFLNPGLLGSAESFATRFARPIEIERDAVTRDRLKRLLSPFLLRRSKTAVLEELPPRTEVTLRVELEFEEAALYEAIRQETLDTLRKGASGSQRTMHLLAGITRLRRAASNARMVLPDRDAPSAKLAALGELLDDLLPGHKVLVFSQFVDHLKLVREMLEARKVTFQYLDGSTPVPARRTAIDAFQAGVGDVFLISLRAGGVGLNLTAADYVVHMDPWWNPAVEDQASDRAHRIGQRRPVTIYRLVARDTIEDRILDLHRRKRDLAVSLLDGSDAGASITEQEMLDLLRAGRPADDSAPRLGESTA